MRFDLRQLIARRGLALNWHQGVAAGLREMHAPVAWVFFATLVLFMSFICADARAAITRVGASGVTIAKTGDGTITALGVPVGTSANDLMLLVLSGSGVSFTSVTPPAGWALVNLTGGVGHSQAIFWKKAVAAETGSYRFDWLSVGAVGGNERTIAYIVGYRGVDTVTPISAQGGQYNASVSNTVTAPAITTIVTNAQLVGFFGLSNNAGGGTLPASMTNPYSQSSGGGAGATTVLSGDQALTSPGATGTRVATFGLSTVGVGHLIALRALRSFRVEAVASGNIGTQVTGTNFNLKITALSPAGTTDTTFTGTVVLSSTGSLSAGSGTTATFVAGVLVSTTVRISNTGTFTITATETGSTNNVGVSNSFVVAPMLRVLVPGETAAPGTITGKSGTPSVQTPGTAFNVTVHSVDEFWNVVTTATDVVALSSSDTAAGLPAAAALVSGSKVFTVTLNTGPSQTITASASAPVRSSISSSIPLTLTIGSFNVFETTTPASAISGRIFTQTAGSAFSLDVVAIASGAQSNSFTQSVKVELLSNNGTAGAGYGADNCPSSASIVSTITSTPITNGRSTVPFVAVANVYRDVRVRVTYSGTTPAVTSCSTDSFAIIPESFTMVAQDVDRSTAFTGAGPSRVLTSVDLSDTVFHNAGKPFTIMVTAFNGAGTPIQTTNYSGAPVATISACSGSACTTSTGNLDLGVWTISGGAATTTTATYSEVGAFSLQVKDTNFASIDALDGTSVTRRTIASPVINVGRFVPDHFTLSSPVLINRSDLPTCDLQTTGSIAATSNSLFVASATAFVVGDTILIRGAGVASLDLSSIITAISGNTITLGTAAGTAVTSAVTYRLAMTYMDEAFGIAYTITAKNGLTVPTTTQFYTGSLAKSVVSLVAENNNDGNNRAARLSTTAPNWSNGMYVAASGTSTKFLRNAMPDGPYDALQIGVALTDVDGSVLNNLNMDAATNTNCISLSNCTAFAIGSTRMRYGRLKLSSAHGSELLNLPIPMEAQYWNGTSFVRNLHDSCTNIAPANIIMNTYQKNLAPSSPCKTSASITGSAFLAGRGDLRLAAPGNGNSGSVNLAVNLAGGSGSSCTATGVSEITSSSAVMPYLQGNWLTSTSTTYDQNPTSRATFGIHKNGPVIYMREMY